MKNTLKVVLADDEALIRLDIREMLTEAGHEVAGEANNGEGADAMTIFFFSFFFFFVFFFFLYHRNSDLGRT